MRPLLFLTSFVIASACSNAALAHIYSYVDQNGQRHFTDQPPNELSTPVKVAPTASIPATPIVIKRSPVAEGSTSAFFYATPRITLPAHDSTLTNHAGNLSAHAHSPTALHPGHQLHWWLDQQKVGHGEQLSLTNIDRGSHQLHVTIEDEHGQALAESHAITFHVQRPSLTQKRRVNPCKLPDYGVRPECPLEEKPKPKSWWQRL